MGSGEGRAMSEEVERGMVERRATEGAREMGREKRVTAEDNLGQGVEIGEGASTVFGRRIREEVDLM